MQFIADYIGGLLWGWVGIVFLVLGLVDIIERSVEKTFTISRRWKVMSVLAILFIAQFLTYKDLRRDTDKKISELEQANAVVATANEQQQVKVEERDKRIGDLEAQLHKLPIRIVLPPTQRNQGPAEHQEMPIMTGLRFSGKAVASPKPGVYPYGYEAVVQVESSIQPVWLIIECDAELGEVRLNTSSGGPFINQRSGFARNRRVGLEQFQYPPLTPENPLVVTVMSKTPIKILNIRNERFSF